MPLISVYHQVLILPISEQGHTREGGLVYNIYLFNLSFGWAQSWKFYFPQPQAVKTISSHFYKIYS